MAAPSVHLLTSAVFGSTTLADPISASVDEGGSVQEYAGADSSDLKLVAVDRIAQTVVVNTQGYNATPAIGDVASGSGLVLHTKVRAEGAGTTGSDVPLTFAKAICIAKSSGPTIEGTPTFSLTFRCHATA